MRQVVLVLALAAAFAACGDSGSQAETPPAPSGGSATRLLVVTHTAGFRHDSIPAAEAAIQALGAETGLFRAEFCRTADEVKARLTPQALADVDAVFFANTTGDLGIADLPGFLDWIAGGKGFIGAHSASDTYHNAPEFLEMLGGEFTSHGSIVEAEVRVNDPSHPAVSHLAPSFRIADEWYRIRQMGSGHTMLLSIERNPPDGLGTPNDAVNLPIAWQKPLGKGRVFYTAMGHRAEVWNDPRFRRHILEGIRWALAR